MGDAVSFSFVEPEVAGGWGPNTVADRSTTPVTVEHLHYEFDGWLGDVLLESTPCFIVTDAGVAAITKEGLVGAEFENVEISVSDTFRELRGDVALPSFRRLVPFGTPGIDDFGLSPDLRLVLSDKAIGLLRNLGLNYAELSPYP